MDYNLFKKVFFNIIIRKKIFKFVTELNKGEGKKYNSTKIKWIVSSFNFQLLVYKFKVEPKKRNEFTVDMFYTFLQNNYDIELFKQLLILFPSILESNNKSKVIENCCLLNCFNNGNDIGNGSNDDGYGNGSFSGINNSKEELILNMVKFVIKELNIEPTSISIDNTISKSNISLLNYFIEIGYLNLKENNKYQQVDYGLVHCSLNSRNFKFFEYLLNECPINWSICRDKNILCKMIDTGNIQFIKHSLENKQLDRDQPNKQTFLLEYIIKNGTIEIIKYLFNQDPFYKCQLQSNKYILSQISTRNDINILKYIIEDLKIDHEFINQSNMLQEYCSLGNLECCKYLYNNIENLKFTTKCMDNCLYYHHSSNSKQLFHWLFKVSPVGCSFYGLRYCTRKIHSHGHEIRRILRKYRSNFTNEQILRLIVTNSMYCENIENFNFLSSYLPENMVPSFPVEEVDEYIYDNNL